MGAPRNIRPRHHWPELYTGPWTITGNVAKVKVLHELHGLVSQGSSLEVLDVGCVGLQPLHFWEPLLGRFTFHVTAVDVQGIERAQAVVNERGWHGCVTLHEGSGYSLSNLLAQDYFDIIVATQVLEHVAQLPRFMRQVAAVLRRGGEGFFTFDSAHSQARFEVRYPVQALKNLVKKGLALIGHERHYDLGYFDQEVTAVCQEVGLQVLDCRYYNLAPLKFLHNHILPEEHKNPFMERWFELEEWLNEEEEVRAKARHLFLGLYFHICKP